MTLTARLAHCRKRDRWDHDPTEEEVLGDFVYDCLMRLFGRQPHPTEELVDRLLSALVDDLGSDPGGPS